MGRRKKTPWPPFTLTRFSVHGFKAVRSSGWIKLQPLTLLIGRNGSGKSSLVEALRWLQDTFFDGLNDATEKRFRAYSYLRNQRCSRTKLSLELETSTGKLATYDLAVGATRASPDRVIIRHEELRLGRAKGQTIILRTAKGSRGPVHRVVAGFGSERNADRLALDSLGEGNPSLAALADFLQRVVVLRLSPTAMRFEASLARRREGRMLDDEGEQLPALLDSFGDKQRAAVRRSVSGVISGVKDLSVHRTDRSHGYVETQEQMPGSGRKGVRDVPLPAWVLSEGTRRITALFALLASKPRPSLLVIEEIENGLDPWTMELVIATLRQATTEGTQVILATHSSFLLDHVKTDEVIHVQRSGGDTTYGPIQKRSVVAKFEDVIAPGAMYLAGYFDGKAE